MLSRPQARCSYPFMLEGNVNHHVVQEMLGHANIMHTMDTYSHVLPNMAQQAAERLDTMLG